MKMSGVITITTDFGHQGPFVGVMKGVMLSRMPQARIIDLTHEIVVHWPAEAGFWLARSFGYFPQGTVHVAVVDPGVGTSREIIAVTANGHVFLAPDNGLLAPVVGRNPGASIVKLTASRLAHFGVQKSQRNFPWPGHLCADRSGARCRTLLDQRSGRTPDDSRACMGRRADCRARCGQRRRHHHRPLRQSHQPTSTRAW